MRSMVLLSMTTMAAFGCGSDAPTFPDTVPVSGTVTLGGKPVDQANVTFVPVDSNMPNTYSASAITGPDGKYVLSTFFSGTVTEEGAVPGDYRVTVSKVPAAAAAAHGDNYVEPPAQKGPANVLPAKYAGLGTTSLQFTVESGKPNDIQIDLK